LVRCTGLSGAPTDSVRCTRGLQVKLVTFGKIQRHSAIIHRTVRCTPDSVRCPKEERLWNSPASGICSAIIHRTVRCTPDCPVSQRSNGYFAPTVTCRSIKCAQSAQKSGTRDVAHRTLYSACPVCHRTSRRAQQSELQRSELNGLVTWLAHRTLSGVHRTLSGVHRTVRCTIQQQPPPNG
jgi:hypothetical protein